MNPAVLAAGLGIATIGLDLVTGKRSDVAAASLEIAKHALPLIPVEHLRAYLDDFDRAAIDAAADVAEEQALKERGQP